jgi:hypothetical protein
MKHVNFVMAFLVVLIALLSCQKDKNGPSERFTLLTSHIWESDSLLANGVDASGPGELLEDFAGDARFNTDGTGYFGAYTGTWAFSSSENYLTINSDSIPVPLTAKIEELTELSLKITTSFPAIPDPIDIRITFKNK